MTIPAEIQTYFDKMETLMNDCQKHVEAMELDKAKEKNQEILLFTTHWAATHL